VNAAIDGLPAGSIQGNCTNSTGGVTALLPKPSAMPDDDTCLFRNVSTPVEDPEIHFATKNTFSDGSMNTFTSRQW